MRLSDFNHKKTQEESLRNPLVKGWQWKRSRQLREFEDEKWFLLFMVPSAAERTDQNKGNKQGNIPMWHFSKHIELFS